MNGEERAKWLERIDRFATMMPKEDRMELYRTLKSISKTKGQTYLPGMVGAEIGYMSGYGAKPMLIVELDTGKVSFASLRCPAEVFG